MMRSSRGVAAVVLSAAVVSAWAAGPGKPPRVFLLDGPVLVENAARIKAGAADLDPALAALRREAQQALTFQALASCAPAPAPADRSRLAARPRS